MILPRRSFISSIIALAAAPAIVRASSIMPVKVMPPLEPVVRLGDVDRAFYSIGHSLTIYGRDIFGKEVVQTMQVGPSGVLQTDSTWKFVDRITVSNDLPWPVTLKIANGVIDEQPPRYPAVYIRGER